MLIRVSYRFMHISMRMFFNLSRQECKIVSRNMADTEASETNSSFGNVCPFCSPSRTYAERKIPINGLTASMMAPIMLYITSPRSISHISLHAMPVFFQILLRILFLLSIILIVVALQCKHFAVIAAFLQEFFVCSFFGNSSIL